MDEALLNTAQLKQFVCYQTFAYYIMPKLSVFSDEDDSFTRKMELYISFVEREWNKVKDMALYDFDGDDAFSDTERTGPVVRKLGRS